MIQASYLEINAVQEIISTDAEFHFPFCSVLLGYAQSDDQSGDDNGYDRVEHKNLLSLLLIQEISPGD
jgi:hypothetical protein